MTGMPVTGHHAWGRAYGHDKHPLLNVMLTCPNGNIFIGSINISGEQKDGHYICNALGGYIKTIRVNNIIQICTNNALNMKSPTNLLIRHFSSLYF
jgi:hypothetical protein